jgi:hypothetical protein
MSADLGGAAFPRSNNEEFELKSSEEGEEILSLSLLVFRNEWGILGGVAAKSPRFVKTSDPNGMREGSPECRSNQIRFKTSNHQNQRH